MTTINNLFVKKIKPLVELNLKKGRIARPLIKSQEMKMIYLFLSILMIVSCVSGKEKTYTGSTPANSVIRSFLGIPLTDSVEFIRWKIILRDNQYQLQCNYGIGMANSNGFINGGKKIDLKGKS